MIYLLIFYLVTLTHCSERNIHKQIGETCIIENTQKSGICNLICDCPSVLQTFRTNRPTICGYINHVQIICCPNHSADDFVTSRTQQDQDVVILNKSNRHLKCLEYANAANETKGSQFIYNQNSTKISKCAVATSLPVSGLIALPREFPHSASLGYETNNTTINWNCGGALISPNYVLTTGNCLNYKNQVNVSIVRFGDLNVLFDTNDEHAETLRVAEVILHPSCNDIALLRLNDHVTLSSHIRPICLPSHTSFYFNERNTRKVIATGWGTLTWGSDCYDSLFKTTLDIFRHNDCSIFFSHVNETVNEETQICAGIKSTSQDICYGNRGGLLQIFHPDIYCSYTLIGISSSSGQLCGTPNIPSIYTRIEPFVEWIERVVWQH